jgi:hypothetical protein
MIGNVYREIPAPIIAERMAKLRSGIEVLLAEG